MVEYHVRNRHRLRKKEVRKLSEELNNIFSERFNFEDFTIDSAEFNHQDIFILDNEVFAWRIDDKVFFTIRGLLRFKPEKRFVTVDMGAIKYVSNGADIMAPGIIDADKEIFSGDLVWIRDENNLKPLAVGQGLMAGSDMVSSNSDKAVKSLHYIGDKIWKIQL
jgi:PUA domain protein